MAGKTTAPRNPSWRPGDYLAFTDARLRPALDLIARIPEAERRAIADLGCGPGQLLPHLRARWPEARIVGIDADPAMLAKARAAYPEANWTQADIATWRGDEPLDLVFSNAALHWVADHAAVFPRLMNSLRPGGVLAVQMPDTGHGAWRQVLRDLARSPSFSECLGDFETPAHTLDLAGYRRLLQPLSSHLDLWASEYLHALEGETPVADWTLGAGGRPYLDLLPESERARFRKTYAEALTTLYPREPSGETLFGFRRLFILAVKA
jgi:trans-aconitate 2-methyltransferase